MPCPASPVDMVESAASHQFCDRRLCSSGTLWIATMSRESVVWCSLGRHLFAARDSSRAWLANFAGIVVRQEFVRYKLLFVHRKSTLRVVCSVQLG